jgi:hypothetical protein
MRRHPAKSNHQREDAVRGTHTEVLVYDKSSMAGEAAFTNFIGLPRTHVTLTSYARAKKNPDPFEGTGVRFNAGSNLLSR